MKSLALTCILKNEVHNLERFCKSFSGLVDEVVFVDTGSTDGSVDWLNEKAYLALNLPHTAVHVCHFTWVDDFAAARNFGIEKVKSDYWMWADLDDVLNNRENFKAWKSEAIGMHPVWYVPYNYSLKPDGSPAVSFVRERVFKTDLNFRFQDPIHEGVDIRKAGVNVQGALNSAWSIDHLRTFAEMDGDKKDGRNIRILEKNKGKLSARLQFYYGKELFDNQRFKEAHEALLPVCKSDELETGDRIMAMQFMAHSLIQMNEFGESLKYSSLGLVLDPERAEYYCMMADAYLRMNEPQKAVPLLQAAKSCQNRAGSGTRHEFSYADCYNVHPRLNLAQIYFFQGKFEETMSELEPILDQIDDKFKTLYQEAQKAILATKINNAAIDCDDIVFTCPFPTPYPWDEEGYKTKGYGGSETACIEMAKWLKEKTGRCVKIFQNREELLVAESGVEYHPAHKLHAYFNKWKPSLHIAWRHTARFTNAPSYVWSHDLFTPGAEQTQNYDKILALSGAHRDMLIGMQGIPKEKIIVTSNGIEPKRFLGRDQVTKTPGKVIWPNSLDRGFQYAIQVMDQVVEHIPEAELHVFYGFDNMKKAGGEMAEMAKGLEEMISTRPYIKYHGNVDQTVLAKHFMESSVWLYTASFYETFCISGIEALASRCWPVVRKFGALKDTLKDAEANGWADIIDMNMDASAIPVFAEKVIAAIKENKWERIDFKPESKSWENLAKEWVDMFNL